MRTKIDNLRIKLESDIKREPDDHEPTANNSWPPSGTSRDILMDFGMNRKKIIHLDGTNSLFTECKRHVGSDPALSDLLLNSYPVFQEYAQKFNTWVDIDCENNLRDGAVVKVMFFPKEVETDLLNPGSIKRKRENLETNRKQYSVHGNDINKKSNSLCDENAVDEVESEVEVEYVATKRRLNISPAFDTWESEQKPVLHTVAVSPVNKVDSFLLHSKVNIMNTQVPSRNIQPQNIREAESTNLQPGIPPPSNAFEQTRGSMLSEKKILNVSSAPVQLSNEGSSKGKKPKKKHVTSSSVQPLHVENQHGIGSQSSTVNVTSSRVQPLHVENQHGIGSQSSTVNVTPASAQPLLLVEKPPPSCPEKSARESKVSERSIIWETFLTPDMMEKRLKWCRDNSRNDWHNIVFSDVAMFGLEGNSIKLYEKIEFNKGQCKVFWGFRSFAGENVMAPLRSTRALNMAEILRDKVLTRIKRSDLTIQYLDNFKTQFSSKVMKRTLKKKKCCFMWPYGAKDLFPVHHAWKLVGEKVKNIPCSSEEEMISIITKVWEEDLEVQKMCSELISLLPKIIKNVIHWLGSFPRITINYAVSN